LLIGAAFVWVVRTDFGQFRPTIESALSARLGREVTIEQSLEVRIGGTLSIAASGVRVANAEWASDPEFLAIERFELELPLLALMRRPIDITRFEAAGVSLSIETGDDGRDNLPPGRPGSDEVDQDATDGPFPVLFRHVELEDVDIRWRQPNRNTPLVLSLQAFDHHLAADGMVRAEVRGALDGKALAYEGIVGTYDALLEGQDVRFDGRGQFGDVRFEGSATIDSLARPERPVFDISLDGDNFGAVAHLFGRDAPAGGFSIRLASQHLGDGIQLTLRGDVGATRLDAAANMPSISSINHVTFDLDASGPRLDRVASLLDLGEWPASPFRLTGHLQRNGEDLLVNEVRIDTGEARLALEAHVPHLPTLENAKGTFELSGPDLSRFARLLGQEGRVSGAFDAKFSLARSGAGANVIEGYATTSLGRLQVTGEVGSGERLAGSRLKIEVTGQDAGAVLGLFDVAGYEGQGYRLAGEVGIHEQGVSIREGTTLDLGELHADVHGDLPTTGYWEGTRLVFSVHGNDLASHIPALADARRSGAVFRWPGGPFQADGQFSYTGDALVLSGINLVSEGLDAGADIELQLPLDEANGHFDIQLSGGSTGLVWSATGAYAPPGDPFELAVRGTVSTGNWSLETARLQLADARLALQGEVGPWPGLEGTDISVQVDITDLSRLGQWRQRSLPAVSLKGGARVDGNRRAFRVDALDITSGHSDIRGDAAFDFTGAVPTVSWNSHSGVLDLSVFAGDEGSGHPAGSPTVIRKPGLPFPDVIFPLERLAQLDSDFDISADRLQLENREYAGFALRASTEDGALRVSRLQGSGLQGDLRGTFSLVPDGGDNAIVELNSSASGLRLNLSRELVQDPAVLPALEYRVAVQGRGSSLYETLETLDGTIIVSVSGGTIPNSVLAFMEGGLLEQVMHAVLPNRLAESSTTVSCAAARLVAEDGVLRTEPGIALVTDKIRMASHGEIDLSDGRLDLNFESHPNEIYRTNVTDLLVNPFVRFSGTLAAPKISFDKPKALLSAGLAVGTGGLSILAKHAFDRIGMENDPCAHYEELLKNLEPAPTVSD